MIRFLQTGDWQLGMTRHFFSEGVQERFAQSRFDAIRKLGQIAKEEDCQFVVVCGDVFESNQVDRKTVSRALDALKDMPCPVYLLPGNHDPLDAGSVYRSSTFLERKPAHVHVIEDITPIRIDKGVEILGAPWTSKRPMQDLVGLAIADLAPATEVVRICVAHGAVDRLSPNPDDPSVISLAVAEEAIQQNKLHFIALGDRHSLTKVSENNRIWYAGTFEATGYRETESGSALVVTIDNASVSTQDINVGAWNFIERENLDLNTSEDVEGLERWLEEIEDKERTVLKLRFVGTISLGVNAQLENILNHFRELMGALETRTQGLTVIPEDADFQDLGFSGFTNNTVERLRSEVEKPGADVTAPRDALSLLIRLVGQR